MLCDKYFTVSLSLPLQSSWVISVELAIGPEEGISYLTDKGSTVSDASQAHTLKHQSLGNFVMKASLQNHLILNSFPQTGKTRLKLPASRWTGFYFATLPSAGWHIY